MAPNFAAWIEENGTTTLEKEVCLAKALYDEAEGLAQTGEDQVLMQRVEDTIQSLRERVFDPENLVHGHGLSVNWILDVFAKQNFIKHLIDFDCPLWFVRKVCIMEYLQRQDKTITGPLIQHVHQEFVLEEPHVFLSYAGRSKLAYFMKVLEELRGKYVWMDVFCVDQSAWTNEQDR